jgi:hypothetical protein
MTRPHTLPLTGISSTATPITQGYLITLLTRRVSSGHRIEPQARTESLIRTPSLDEISSGIDPCLDELRHAALADHSVPGGTGRRLACGDATPPRALRGLLRP